MASEDWRQTWNAFFGSLGTVMAARAQRLPDNSPLAGLIRERAPGLIGALTSGDAWNGASAALDAFEAHSGSGATAALRAELDVIATMNAGSAASGDIARMDRSLTDSETGKGSIEDLLDLLPDWLKTALKLVNQLIRLLRGAT